MNAYEMVIPYRDYKELVDFKKSILDDKVLIKDWSLYSGEHLTFVTKDDAIAYIVDENNHITRHLKKYEFESILKEDIIKLSFWKMYKLWKKLKK